MMDVLEFNCALEGHGIEVYFKPLVNIETGEVGYCKAIARWNHPEHGLLSAAQVADFAERAGKVDALNYVVISKTLKCLKQIQLEMPGFCITVKVQASSLKDIYLADCITNLLSKNDIDAKTLQLEAMPQSACKDEVLATVPKGYYCGQAIPSADPDYVIESFMLYSAKALMAKHIESQVHELKPHLR